MWDKMIQMWDKIIQMWDKIIKKTERFDFLFLLIGYALLACGIFLLKSAQNPGFTLVLSIGGFAFILISYIMATSIRRPNLNNGKVGFLFLALVVILVGLMNIITLEFIYLGLLGIVNFALAIIVLSLFAMCRERH